MRKPNKRNSDRNSKRGRDESRFTKERDLDSDYNCQKSKSNDWRWYAQNEALLRDSASFPYTWPLGTRLNMGGEVAVDVNKGSIPGIMAIHTAPAFGWSDQSNSPINVAMRNIYSFVRHANSGSAMYDAPDLMLYLGAMDNLYSYLSYLKRIYGVAMTYSLTNRYYPKAIVEAMGVDFDSLQSNLADFRAAINVLAVKIGSLCVPASMSYFAKHMWMYDGYYLDSNQDKAQTYLFVPDGFFQFGLDDDGAGMLYYKPLGMWDSIGSTTPSQVEMSDLLDYHQLIDYGNQLIMPILTSEDMNIMSGDILKAFGSNMLYKVDGVSETYTVLPSYDEEVLSQIENLSLIGSYVPGVSLVQDVTKGWLNFTPALQHPYAFPAGQSTHPGYNVYLANNFVNFHHDQVSPADTMVATRMSNIAHSIDYEENTLTYHTIGSEIACYAYIYYYSEWNGSWLLTRSRTLYQSNTGVVSFMSESSKIPVTVSGRVSMYTDAKSTTGDLTSSVSTIRPISLGSIPVASVNANAAVSEIMNVFLLAEQLSMFDWHPAMALNLGIQGTTVNPNLSAINFEIGGISGMSTSAPAAGGVLANVTPLTNDWFVDAPVYGRYNGVLLDVNYYTILTEQDLQQMAEVALLSEFNITQYGRQ